MSCICRRWWLIVLWLFVVSGYAQQSPFLIAEPSVVRSPNAPAELPIGDSQKVIDSDVWSSRPDATILVRGSRECRVLGWHVGSSVATTIIDLPPEFECRAIATHPRAHKFFVSGRAGGQSIIMVAETAGNVWRTSTIFKTDRELRRLLVAPRPFEVGYDQQRKQPIQAYRLLFGERLPDGSYSVRSITEDGKSEYQVIGPKSGYVQVPGADIQPTEVLADSALPAAFHPEGDRLIWDDARGCHHQLPYEGNHWGKASAISNIPCGGSITVTPNGAGLLHWQRGQAGITILLDRGGSRTQQATQYAFASTPSSVPDGRGIVGLVQDTAGSRLVYAPIDVALADVVNAWMFVQSSADRELFLQNAGLFRPLRGDQLYQLYDSELYRCDGYDSTTPTRPYLVTTDIFWELVAAAYEGTFIVQERQQAMPAFWSFVETARGALNTRADAPSWAAAFEAISALHGNRTAANREAATIARASGRTMSPVFGQEFDFTELKPRGHYTATPEMATYFKAVHYLTELARLSGSEALSSLPDDVKKQAMRWIASYQPYLAPSRGPLVWDSQPFAPPAYARHPAKHAMLFPLSWGFDNEVLLSTVFHADWPQGEQITGTNGPRLVPSGLDLAAALGSGYARSLLKADLRDYPALGAVLDSLAARRGPMSSNNLYDDWITALATQWADDEFPGSSWESGMWKLKRVQTGLASWATLRHATVLVNERTVAECGEGGFEEIVLRPPRGYVEPDPKTFAAIASLFDHMVQSVTASADFKQGILIDEDSSSEEPLRQGILRRLRQSAEKARLFQSVAQKELRGEELTDAEYEEILYVGRVAEHQFLVYKSLANKDLGLSTPDPMMKIADVAGGGTAPILEAAVGGPLEWDQIVPFFGRREIVKGSAYSYYEFTTPSPLTDEEWRARVDREPRPKWIQPFLSEKELPCPAPAPF